MKHYKAVCFDFDYTLGDATDSIVAGFQHGMAEMGWPEIGRASCRERV